MATARVVAFQSLEEYTLEDFLEFLANLLPVDVNRYELIQGRIVMTPPAGYGHGSSESRINGQVWNLVFRKKLGVCLGSSTGLILPSGDFVQPDFTFVSNDRLKGVQQLEQGFMRAVPELVVEILSPSTARIDLNEKKTIYESNGVDEYWIVDRKKRQVTVFHLTRDRYDSGTVFKEDQILTSKVLLGFRKRVRDLI